MRLLYKYWKLRSRWRRLKRLMWSSPGEVRLIELFGGWVWSIRSIKNVHNGHYLTPAYTLGRYFKNHDIKREVRVGKGVDTKFIDFATPNKKAIEVLSKRWHNSVIEDAERKCELEGLGWSVLYIHYEDIKHQPTRTRMKVMKFLSR